VLLYFSFYFTAKKRVLVHLELELTHAVTTISLETAIILCAVKWLIILEYSTNQSIFGFVD